MSVMKREYESHVMHGRKTFVMPSRALWDGSTAKAQCPSCRRKWEYQKEASIPTWCPKCWVRLVVS